ncbi:MAG: transferrin-binding protein-like solute binding protein [Alphaproteobacteria bacterium]|nr:transferrin-binding protein-like solute binding protein [Alphaproteobacteria bacterium]MDE2340033.1 transferrin-binding protein-like solute binding protein [Alphaproteobacteria bacterium]
MRIILALLATSALAACGGGTGGAITSVGTTTTTTTTAGTTTVNNYAEFTNPTTTHTYTTLGGDQTFQYSTQSNNASQQQQIYAANLETPRNSVLSITYNPTAATYTLALNDPATSGSANAAFQDPASKIDFAKGNPQWGTPNNLTTQSSIVYHQTGDGNPISPYLVSGSGVFTSYGNATSPASVPSQQTSTYIANSFFFQQPGGSATQYVTFAGYLRNNMTYTWVTPTNGAPYQNIQWNLTRGAFVYGVPTTNSNVPTTGTATFNGNMIASMVYNLDPQNADSTYFQWITGTASTAVDFGKNTVSTTLTGTVQAPQVDTYTTYNPANATIATGSTFNASGTATINMQSTGGFAGTLSSASFTNGATVTKLNLDPTASVLNGTFYGPVGQEVGGGFRAVGTNPNQRVDIIGAFTGK